MAGRGNVREPDARDEAVRAIVFSLLETRQRLNAGRSAAVVAGRLGDVAGGLDALEHPGAEWLRAAQRLVDRPGWLSAVEIERIDGLIREHLRLLSTEALEHETTGRSIGWEPSPRLRALTYGNAEQP
jgi:hypothetical protein